MYAVPTSIDCVATPLTCNALLAEVLFAQDGVISRQQAIDCGASEGLLRSMLRRGAWVRLHPGVYVNHNGPLTWRQRAWAAVLGAPGSALSHQSALTIAGLGRPGAAIHIAVDRKAHAPERAGVVVHRCAQLTQRVAGGMRPPRVRVEHAVLDVAGEAPSEVDAIAVLADTVRERLTTASRLHSALDSRQWCKRRRLISGVLTDLNEGTCSVLEHAYLTRVERPHGLPTPRRQAPTRVGRRGFRDVDYDEWRLIVELDGRFGHDDAHSRDADPERDLDASVFADKESLRLGWGQVIGRPCSTAGKVAVKLQSLGWSGTPVRCPNCKAPSPTDK